MNWELANGRWLPVWQAKADQGDEVALKKLAGGPRLTLECELYWRCVTDTATDRQIGMSAGPIPWSAVDRWARRHGIDDLDDFEDLWHVVRACSAVIDEHIERNRPRPPGSGPPPAPDGR